MKTRLLKSVGVSGLLAVSGCATRSADSGLANVRSAVADRAGPLLRVEWNTGSAADAAVATSVRTVLSRELSADDAVQIALLNNRRLQATFEDLGIAQADLVQAGLLKNPVFDAEFKFSTAGGGTQVELAVVQEFLDIFRVPLRKRVAEQQSHAATLRVTGEVLDLASRTRMAFYDFQGATQLADLRRTVLAATGAAADFARRLHEAGNITDLQYAREQALNEQSRLELASAEAEAASTRERLNALLGVWGADARWNAAARLADVPSDEMSVEHVESKAVEKSLELALAKGEVESAGQALGLRKAFAWTGEGGPGIGVAAEREAEGGWNVGPAVSLPIPLFDTGAAGVSRAQAEYRRAMQNYYATAVEVRSAARMARDRLQAARDRAEYLRKVLLPLLHTIVEQTQAENNAMLVGTFDVLRAKQDEIEAGAQYVAALRNYWLAHAGLVAVVNGRMTESMPAPSERAGRSERVQMDEH